MIGHSDDEAREKGVPDWDRALLRLAAFNGIPRDPVTPSFCTV